MPCDMPVFVCLHESFVQDSSHFLQAAAQGSMHQAVEAGELVSCPIAGKERFQPPCSLAILFSPRFVVGCMKTEIVKEHLVMPSKEITIKIIDLLVEHLAHFTWSPNGSILTPLGLDALWPAVQLISTLMRRRILLRCRTVSTSWLGEVNPIPFRGAKQSLHERNIPLS